MKERISLSRESVLTSLFESGNYLRQKTESVKALNVRFNRLWRRRSLIDFSLLGLAIRFVLAPFLGHPYDMRIFMAVSWAVAHGITPYGQYVLQEIFQNMPHPHLFGSFYGIGYPPSWGLILGFMYQVASLINPNNIYTLILALKIPIILGDLAASLVIYKILELKLNKQAAFKAFCLYQLCPFVIVIGAVWGMFDVLVFLLSILSAYFLMEKREWSLISLAAACSLKPYPIVLAPLYSIFIYKTTQSVKKVLSYFFGVIALISLITMIPMSMFKWPLSNLYYALSSHMSSTDFYYNIGAGYTYGAASPLNVFNVFRLIDTTIKPHWILNYVWIIACVALYFYAIIHISEVNFTSIVNWSFLVSLVFFTTRFWVSEQNLIFLFSLFLLVVLFNRLHAGWKYIHTVWILFFTFVMVHVPAIAFLWIVYPWTLNAATAFCDGPLGPVRWVLMSGMTFSWLAILWHYTIRRMTWR